MEIGSIFEISVEDLFVDENQTFKLPFMDELKYNTVRLFNSGRSAIEYTFRHMKSKEVASFIAIHVYTIVDVSNGPVGNRYHV